MATDTALLVIDMQVGNVGAAYQCEEIVARLADLVAAARAPGRPLSSSSTRTTGCAPGCRNGSSSPPSPRRKASWSSTSVPAMRSTRRRYGRSWRRGACGTWSSPGCRPSSAWTRPAAAQMTSEGFDVTLVADGHTTEDTPTLPAAQIIEHHNRTLGNLAHPDHPITVRPRAEIAL